MGRRAVSFDSFFAEDHARLVSGLTLLTGDREVAAEAVAEAIARAWEHVRRGREIENLEAWIRTVALNCARRTFRRRASERRAQERLASDSVVASQSGPASSHERVQSVLAGLPPREREVAVMRYVFGPSPVEVARELGLSRGTVDNYLHKAKDKLKIALSLDEGSSVEANHV